MTLVPPILMLFEALCQKAASKTASVDHGYLSDFTRPNWSIKTSVHNIARRMSVSLKCSCPNSNSYLNENF